MKVRMRDLTVMDYLFKHWSSSYTFTLTLGIHFGCRYFLPKSDLITYFTAGLIFGAFVYNIWDLGWGIRTNRKEVRKLKIDIARLQKTVPNHIPDKQVLKYLKKKKKGGI